jgi:hypothetical protein
MRSTLIMASALGLLLGCGRGGDGTADRSAAADQTRSDTMVSGSAATGDSANDAGLTWGLAPPGLPAGAKVAVISGDPGKAGPFTVRIDMPPDYTIRPHYHPTSETLRLIEGTVHFAHGAKWDDKAMKEVSPDAPVTLAAKEPHYLHAANHVVLEVQSTGPFAITYVSPKDDPRSTSKP